MTLHPFGFQYLLVCALCTMMFTKAERKKSFFKPSQKQFFGSRDLILRIFDKGNQTTIIEEC